MSLPKTLIATIVLLAATLFIVKVELPRQEKEEREELFLEGLAAHEIRDVTISSVSGEKLSLSREKSSNDDHKSSWIVSFDAGKNIVKETLIDEGAVATLTGQLETMRLTKPIPREEIEGDISIYGLDKPLIKVTVKGDETTREIDFGKRNDFTGKRYVRDLSTGDTYLVAESAYTALNKKPFELRSKNRFDFDRSNLREIELIHGDSSAVKLTSSNGLNWKIVEPVEAPADQVAVTELLRQIRGLRANAIYDDKAIIPEEFSGREPDVIAHLVEDEGEDATSYRIAVTGGTSETPQMLVLEQETGKPPFTVAGNAISQLRLGVEQLRQKRFFDFDLSAVTRGTVEVAGKQVLLLEKQGEDWRVNGEPGDLVFIEEYLETLANFEAEEFADNSSEEDSVTSSPFLKILLSFGDKGERTLVVGSERKSVPEKLQRLVEVGPSKEVFFVSNDRLDSIVPKPETLIVEKSSTLPEADGDAASKIAS
jgi:hypothetical protein